MENKEIQYNNAFLTGIDLLSISTFFYFEKSDATGFTLLPTEHKIRFANEMKIPLLTLGLWYMWIPDLNNTSQFKCKKYYTMMDSPEMHSRTQGLGF